jgi:hypothetical protein
MVEPVTNFADAEFAGEGGAFAKESLWVAERRTLWPVRWQGRVKNRSAGRNDHF